MGIMEGGETGRPGGLEDSEQMSDIFDSLATNVVDVVAQSKGAAKRVQVR